MTAAVTWARALLDTSVVFASPALRMSVQGWAPKSGGRIVSRSLEKNELVLLKWDVQIPYLFHENHTPF